MSFVRCDFCGRNFEVYLPKPGLCSCPYCEAPVEVAWYNFSDQEEERDLADREKDRDYATYMKQRHGGPRPGSGRKPMPPEQRKQQRTITWPAEVADMARKLKAAGYDINGITATAIRKKYKRHENALANS